MAIAAELTQPRQFCSVNARSLGADPVGTAPMYDEFVMLEFDLPWARNVVDSHGFPEGVATAVAEAKSQGRRIVLHAFAPDKRYSRPGMRRVMYFKRQAGQYVPAEFVVPEGDADGLVRGLLLGEGDGARWQEFKVEREGVRDLFVCTHGVRDACCGKFGAVLQMELDELVQGREGGAVQKTRVWRVNHIGGHRFAPTLVELPAARYWGALQSDILPSLLDEPANLEPLRPFYRGWSALRTTEEQVAEAEAWLRIGPAWLTYDKTVCAVAPGQTANGEGAREAGSTLESGAGSQGVDVTIEWTDPATDAAGRIDVTVEVGHVLTLPESCGKDDVESKQYVVSRYDEKSC